MVKTKSKVSPSRPEQILGFFGLFAVIVSLLSGILYLYSWRDSPFLINNSFFILLEAMAFPVTIALGFIYGYFALASKKHPRLFIGALCAIIMVVIVDFLVSFIAVSGWPLTHNGETYWGQARAYEALASIAIFLLFVHIFLRKWLLKDDARRVQISVTTLCLVPVLLASPNWIFDVGLGHWFSTFSTILDSFLDIISVPVVWLIIAYFALPFSDRLLKLYYASIIAGFATLTFNLSLTIMAVSRLEELVLVLLYFLVIGVTLYTIVQLALSVKNSRPKSTRKRSRS